MLATASSLAGAKSKHVEKQDSMELLMQTATKWNPNSDTFLYTLTAVFTRSQRKRRCPGFRKSGDR